MYYIVPHFVLEHSVAQRLTLQSLAKSISSCPEDIFASTDHFSSSWVASFCVSSRSDMGWRKRSTLLLSSSKPCSHKKNGGPEVRLRTEPRLNAQGTSFILQ